MFGLFAGVTVIVIAFVALGFSLKRGANEAPVWRLRPRQAFSLLGVLVMLAGCYTSVPTGYTGIVTTFGRVENVTLEAGMHFKNPLQSVALMDNREQKSSYQFSAFSSDIQQVDVKGSVNFNIDKSTAMVLYKEVGANYFDILVSPRMLENTKAVFSKYSAENLVGSRDMLSTQICDEMRKDMDPYGIRIVSVAIEDIDFTDSFTSAVEEKQVAAQNKLTAETKQEQQTMEAQAAATREKIAAQAAAEVQRINADAAAYEIEVRAKADAEANALIAQSISDRLIQYNYAKTWDGKLPTTFMGDSGALPVINVNGISSDPQSAE